MGGTYGSGQRELASEAEVLHNLILYVLSPTDGIHRQ